MTPYHVRHPAPSTFDAPPILGAQDDPVLATLKEARRRYAKHGVEGTYLDTETNIAGRNKVVSVCAAGALMAADRKVREQYHDGGSAWNTWEEYARKSTKVALRLLNESAEMLYSDLLGNYSLCEFGLIENLNEGNFTDASYEYEPRHAMVLECYDHAIALRAGATA